jgi:hypothetical protein
MGATGQPPTGIGGFPPMGATGQPPTGIGGFPPVGATGQPPSGFRGAMGIGGFPPMGATGQPPTGIGGFPPIGATGQPPMGAIGQPPTGNRGAIGIGGFPPMGATGQPPMGFRGAIGSFPPMGATGQPPMGFRGAMGIGGFPPMGATGQPPNGIGGFPPIGIGGFPPMGNIGQPPTGNLGGPPGGNLQPGDYVTVVVELKGTKQEAVSGLRQPVLFLNHKWGKTAYHEDDEIQLFSVLATDQKKKIPQAQWSKHAFLDTPAEQYKQERAKLTKSKDSDLLTRYLELAEWCLQHGLPDNCIEVLGEIEKMAAEGGDKSNKRVAGVLAAWSKVKPIIADEVTKQPKANVWKDKLRYGNVAISKHYALVHNSDNLDRDGVQRRLDDLEFNFKTFYLLFALKGKALPAPSEKLVALLVDPGTFRKQRQLFEVSDLASDGFYARQENLAIFSPVRVDSASRNFEQIMKEVYHKFQIDLLTGKFPDLGKKDAARHASEAARAQVLALVERALREESEMATATHEGTRQLVAETGVLPRNAPAPEWLRFGLASLFEMPKGPFPGKSQVMVKQAFWPGAGGPNWSWRRYLDEMEQEKLLDKPTEILYDTLTDAYFERARAAAKNTKEGEDPDEAHQAALARGRTLSWALTYYLFNDRFDEFQKYLGELAALPRDVEADPYTTVMTFARVFNVETDGLTPKDPRNNLDRYFGISKDWLASVRRFPAPTVALKLEMPDTSGPTPPGNPRPPGSGRPPGFPGFPGGPGGPGTSPIP